MAYAFLSNIFHTVIKTRETLVAAIGLLVILLSLVAIYVLARVIYPRPMWVNHSEDLNAYVNDAFVPEVFKHVNKLSTSNTTLAKDAKVFLDTVGADDLVFFLKFYEYHTSLSFKTPKEWWFTKHERHLIPEGSPESVRGRLASATNPKDIDDMKMKAYINEVLRKVRVLAIALRNWKPGGTTPPPEETMAILRLNLLLNTYRPTLTFMYDTRKTYGFTLQFNIFRLYLSPFYNNIVNRKIRRDVWGSFYEGVESIRDLITQTYRSWKGAVEKLPDRLVSTALGKDKKEKMTDGGQEQVKHTEGVVVENFKQIIEPLLIIAKFFKAAIKLIPMVFKMFAAMVFLITKPQEALVFLISFIVAIIIYILYHIGLVFIELISFVIAYATQFAICLLFTLGWVVVMGVVSIVFVILWVIDLATGGYVMTALRCENLPNAWVYKASYAFGNVFHRLLGCSRPCTHGFKPTSSGLFCGAHKTSSEPNYCPQQLIQQAYENKDVDGFKFPKKYIFDFSPDMSLWIKDDKAKRKVLRDHRKEKVKFLSSCYESLDDYEPLTKAVCTNIDSFFKKDSEIYGQVSHVCKQLYCDYKSVHHRRKGKVAVPRNPEDVNQNLCKQFVAPQELEKTTEKDVVTLTIYKSILFLILVSLSVFAFKHHSQIVGFRMDHASAP